MGTTFTRLVVEGSVTTDTTVHTVKLSLTSDYFFKKHKLFKNRKKREGELQALNVAVTRARRKLYLLFPIDLKTWKMDKAVPNPWLFLRRVDRKLLEITTGL